KHKAATAQAKTVERNPAHREINTTKRKKRRAAMAGPAWKRKLTKVNTASAKLANMHSQAVRQDPEVCLSFIEHPRLADDQQFTMDLAVHDHRKLRYIGRRPSRGGNADGWGHRRAHIVDAHQVSDAALICRHQADAFCAIDGAPPSYRNDDVAASFGIHHCPRSHFFDSRIGGDLRKQRGFETSTLDARQHLLDP